MTSEMLLTDAVLSLTSPYMYKPLNVKLTKRLGLITYLWNAEGQLFLTNRKRSCSDLLFDKYWRGTGTAQWRKQRMLLPPMWPGFESRRRCHYMWVILLFSFFTVSIRVSPQVLRFLSPHKNQHFQIPVRCRNRDFHWDFRIQFHFISF